MLTTKDTNADSLLLGHLIGMLINGGNPAIDSNSVSIPINYEGDHAMSLMVYAIDHGTVKAYQVDYAHNIEKFPLTLYVNSDKPMTIDTLRGMVLFAQCVIASVTQ